MKTKHTRQYAEYLSSGLIPKDNKEAYIEGYIDAIKHTAAPELLEALIRVTKNFKMSDNENLMIQINNAIKKATE
jgi:hypothetical protein